MKILLIGPVAPPISGPSVKNKMMVDWFLNRKDINLVVFNTYCFRNLDIIGIITSIYQFLLAKYVMLSVSKNGRFLFIPICWIFGKKIILFPAGGSFDEEIRVLPKIYKKFFLVTSRAITSTYSQTIALKEGLEDLGFRNVKYFPNPRINRNLTASVDFEDTFKIIFISKIREGKGPLLLLDAVNRFENKYPDIKIELNFYGLVDSGFKEVFISRVEAAKNAHYKGVVESENVQKIISEHNLFVLPTNFPEGVPGAVLEAMFTGIPIVISSFRASYELIENNVDGIIFSQNSIDELFLAIENIVSDRSLRNRLSNAVKLSSSKFEMDTLMNKLANALKDI